MNLIVGATGLLGRRVGALLGAEGQPVRAMARASSNADVVAEREREGATIVEGDLKDRSSLDAACRGASAVISTASSTLSRQPGDSIDSVDREGQIHLIDAARDAGVRRFVLISFNHDTMPMACALGEAKAATERHLESSGMKYTILRASFFMEVWLSPALGFDHANGKATIYGSGEKPVSWIAIDDVAAFAVATLRSPSAENRIIEVGGPEALAPNEVIGIFEKATGKRFDVTRVPEEALADQCRSAEDPMQKSFAALMLNYTDGDPTDMKWTLEEFPISLRSVREYAQAVTRG